MKIMFSAGEVSGDLHGASIATAIREVSPETELIGFGGRQMQAAGVRLVADMADYSVMGVWEVILNIRRIIRLLNHLTDVMKKERPDLLVLIDYPDFNWRLAKRAKEIGIPVFSYIPPSAWAWRKGRAKSCAALADEFAAIFPFETKVYEDAGANISFVGNPLVDKVHASMSDEEAREYFGIKSGEYPVLLMPGSRRQEIKLLFPAMLEGAKRILAEKPDAVFYLPVAQSMAQADMAKMAETAGVPVRFTHDHTYDLMGQAEFALATSGTVILEAALMGLPCIVLYRLSPVSYFFGKLLVHVKFFSLPNILLDEEIQPELLQEEVNPDRILKESRRFWEEPSYSAGVREKLRLACERLGKPNAAKRVAEKILDAAARYGKNKGSFGGT